MRIRSRNGIEIDPELRTEMLGKESILFLRRDRQGVADVELLMKRARIACGHFDGVAIETYGAAAEAAEAAAPHVAPGPLAVDVAAAATSVARSFDALQVRADQ
ncbi:hypothetical protein EVAR_87336_1 [Eumeta japonica]|uniref:Uncharacterized protein n=1 Tax=Eumeta variegata TaxID=151549 RepID=A0A4C1YRW7_EUMVA|nr:hypothetical protein EVAR_87336_1 [Eumeta japonica]